MSLSTFTFVIQPSFPENFSLPKLKLCTHQIATLHSSCLQPWHPPSYSLSLWIWLRWEPHLSRITQYSSWLILCSIMSSWLIEADLFLSTECGFYILLSCRAHLQRAPSRSFAWDLVNSQILFEMWRCLSRVSGSDVKQQHWVLNAHIHCASSSLK